MSEPSTLPVPSSLPGLAEQLAAEAAALEAELAEIDLLVAQARTEAGRHEQRRAQAADKLTAKAGKAEAKELADLNAQLATLTRRAAVMEAQVEVLEGKRKALTRYRDAVAGYAAAIAPLAEGGGAVQATPGSGAEDGADAPPALSRAILGAQEDLRREIARAMHDGPAQSLTNIVLQAQIVERLLERDPASAGNEVRLLTAMVEQTLEATKTFIFDVRPMVLDDLGLVPTLRRTARERGQRASVPIEFESIGVDRRLPVDAESGLFRIVDEVVGAYLACRPDRIAIRLDWTDEALVVEVAASREAPPADAPEPGPPKPGKDVPAALAEMIEDRRREAAGEPPPALQVAEAAWRDVTGRASTFGATAEQLDDGSRVRVELAVPPTA